MELCLKVMEWVVGWPTGFYCQPQSPLDLIGVGTGLDWVGIGPVGIGD